ncbi:MAG: response regulator transcription factor [Magnetococcales bacterium]|nr:response regulator transcription factor [Magnetococcales bacterium]MBF0323227.1 response regulator transcription factor [Magnetococcales bacterium]
MKVLVIDDDRLVNILIAEILHDDGYEILQAFDGPSGIERFQVDGPDLVILDVCMPNMDGCQVAREIKRLCAGRFVPILFLTAMTDAYDLAQCLDSGGDDLITKPFNQNLLEAKLRAWERNLKVVRAQEEKNLLAHTSETDPPSSMGQILSPEEMRELNSLTRGLPGNDDP